MNLRLKNSLILTGTLLIGLVLGVLISGRVMHSKMTRFRNFYTEQGFNRQIMRVIRPTQEQKKQLAPVFRAQAKRNHDLFIQCRENHRQLMEQFKQELNQYLTADQMKRLERMEMRMRKNQPDHFPPPGMKPGRGHHGGEPHNGKRQGN